MDSSLNSGTPFGRWAAYQGISQQRRFLEKALSLPYQLGEFREPISRSPKTHSQTVTQDSTREGEVARAKQADFHLSAYDNLYSTDYYSDLEESINKLQELTGKHQVYITQSNPQQKPVSYLRLIEKIQAPMPFQIFTESHPRYQVTTTGDAYLKFETGILNKLRDINTSNSTSTNSEQEIENYELHQQRIINTLKTINESELNLRLAFINLYLQASESRIKQEAAPIEKEALLDRTVKFLDTNLISPKKNSFLSEDEAQKYAKLFLETIVHIKGINEEFSQSNTSIFKIRDGDNHVNSLYFFKNSLINKILEQSKGLITVNNLELAYKKTFLDNFHLKSVLGGNLIAELKNTTLKTILEQEKFSSARSSINSSTAVLTRALKFLSDQTVSDENSQKDLFKVILMYLKESKNDRSLFFEFLHRMIVKTPEIFTEFQNIEILDDNNQFKEFKNLLLNHLKQPFDNTAKNTLAPIDMKKFGFMQIESADTQDALTFLTMGKSLLKLMQFKDVDIQETAKAFYVKAIKEAKSINCLNGLLQPLSLIESLHSENNNEPSIYDLVPFRQGDLAEYLQQNPLIRRRNTINHLEQMMGSRVSQINSDNNTLLDTYEKILGISVFTQNPSHTNTPSPFWSKLLSSLKLIFEVSK